MRPSIRIRLTAVYSIVFCISTLLLEGGAYLGLRSSISSLVDRELHARTLGIVDFISAHIAKYPLSKVQNELASHAALQPEYLIISAPAGEIWHAKAMDLKSPTPLRMARSRHRIHGVDYDLTVATDMTAPHQILREFEVYGLLSLPLIITIASCVGYWIAGRALRPVAQMTRAAHAISAADLSQRLQVPGTRDELHQLAVTLNSMLGRIDDAFRQVTQFTANASHELRTPIAVMRTTAEVALLRVRPSLETYREALLHILEESEKNSQLLDDMLRLARADSGVRPFPLKPLDLANNVRQACEPLLPLAIDRGLTLQIDIEAPGQIFVAADADHLRRVWLILIDNAMKYTPAPGAIAVIVTCLHDTVVCEVKDSGLGISAEDLPHIFNRFYRSDKARQRDQGGAGLGLSIAQGIVAAHLGSIDVKSTLGQGTTFSVRLPRAVLPDKHQLHSMKQLAEQQVTS